MLNSNMARKVSISFVFFYLITFFKPINIYAQLGGTEGGGDCTASEINTAIGCIDINSLSSITRVFLTVGMSIGGGVGILLIIIASYRIMTSQGDPRRMQGAQEMLTSAIAGLLLLVFSVFLLRVLGIDVLGIF